MNKPNILMIISHDTGRFLGSYGYSVETPELNDMAENGVKFNNYFCSQPQCSPSRGSILTGMYGHNHGMLGLAHMGHSMKKDIDTIPSEMNKLGYETHLIGFFHESIDGELDGEKLGYQHVVNVPGNAAEKVTDKVEAFLKEKSQSEQPFYASVGFEETHRPFDDFDPVPLDEVQVPSYLPDTPKVREDLSYFYGSVKELDKAVGRIKRLLEENGLADTTLLIYTTDHGIAFPRAKGTLLDSGLETALIMRLPAGMRNGGRMQDELLCNIDLMPTLIELAGGNVPDGLDGKSFLPLLADETYEERESFFCELSWHDRYHPMRGIRTKKYKYIRNFEEGPKVYLPYDLHESLTGQEVRDEYYVSNSEEELYDLEKDPLEQNNVADDQQYSHIVKDLREKVEQWMKESNDPLLEGPIPGYEAEEWKKEIEAGNVYKNSGK
ncbi:arylsulfatase A-like enzyme [Salirhabdus euzebyi]|uniref:Arylsulfatase A-like enzyme n=1 Tax=Salirhabdus euzebyi TaxID=394506 RepID=A0A841Q4B4_9BACI|nr:sulfatase [Salirhabdus euzebyi]MBB6453238.1 arylsulfatase A-like enzyme [Salirhabdus euzebyi]